MPEYPRGTPLESKSKKRLNFNNNDAEWRRRRRRRRAALKAGATLQAVEANPIDALWQNRPAAPEGAAWAHPDAAAGQSSGDKRAALAEGLDKESLAAAVLTQTDSIAWLLARACHLIS